MKKIDFKLRINNGKHFLSDASLRVGRRYNCLSYACMFAEMYGACMFSEMYGACMFAEMYGACMFAEMYGACMFDEMCGACMFAEMYGACMFAEMYGAIAEQSQLSEQNNFGICSIQVV